MTTLAELIKQKEEELIICKSELIKLSQNEARCKEENKILNLTIEKA